MEKPLIRQTYKLTPEQAAVFALQPAKKEIIALIAKGLENKEIASVLNITCHTVKAHIVNIMKKTKIKRRTRLAYIFGTLEEKLDLNEYDRKNYTIDNSDLKR